MENEDCLRETQIDIESCQEKRVNFDCLQETQVHLKSDGNNEDLDKQHVQRKNRENYTKEM